MPADPYPAMVAEPRAASRQAMVSWRGNRYSVPPELASATVIVAQPLRGTTIDIATTDEIVIARHERAADGLGATVRDHGHIVALDLAAMQAANTGRPHRRIPPGDAARTAAAAAIAAADPANTTGAAAIAAASVTDLAAYERAATARSRK
jgi:hypothetical protein